MTNNVYTLTRLIISQSLVGAFAFMLGLYSLPIITAPADPSSAALALSIKNTRYVGTISNNLTDSDWLHWGKGSFSIADDYIVFQGKLAPGPDYRLYLSAKFVQTEREFKRLKSTMVEVGKINSFANYILPVNKNINIEHFNSVVIWCEAFDQFITSAQFKSSPAVR